MIYALFRYCKAFKKGYRKVEYKSPKDLREGINKAIKDMFATRKKYREEQLELVKYGSSRRGDMLSKHNSSNINPKMGDRSHDPMMMDNYQPLT